MDCTQTPEDVIAIYDMRGQRIAAVGDLRRLGTAAPGMYVGIRVREGSRRVVRMLAHDPTRRSRRR